VFGAGHLSNCDCRLCPEINPDLKPRDLALGARTPSSQTRAQHAQVLRKFWRTRIICSRCALNAGEGARAPSNHPHLLFCEFFGQSRDCLLD